MPEAEVKKEEKTVDIDTSGPDVELIYPKKRRQFMKLLKTVLSPMTHLRNLMSSWIFEIARTIKNRRKKKK